MWHCIRMSTDKNTQLGPRMYWETQERVLSGHTHSHSEAHNAAANEVAVDRFLQ